MKVTEKLRITKTDHTVITGTFDLKTIEKTKEPRREMFKYNDKEGLKMFRDLTSKNILTKCFDHNDITETANKWLKELQD